MERVESIRVSQILGAYWKKSQQNLLLEQVHRDTEAGNSPCPTLFFPENQSMVLLINKMGTMLEALFIFLSWCLSASRKIMLNRLDYKRKNRLGI